MECKLCKCAFGAMHGNEKYCSKECSGIVNRITRRFVAIKNRCYNKEHQSYSRYKDVGICEEWVNDTFKFVRWALQNGFGSKLQIDRIDNSKGYSPDNCRFVTSSENMMNKKNNVTNLEDRTRICRVCKIKKSFDDFMISRKECHGIAYECKSCRKDIDKAKYLKKKNEETR